jgi:2-keto-4-pentenoate hydratase/2-oxohepta-3-ene-1,7-dioic acid hydratase in catechol pathway
MNHNRADGNAVLEAGRKPPPYPSIFIKPATSVADYGEDIPIPKVAQDEQCDYEGELVSPPRSPHHNTFFSNPPVDHRHR